MPLKKILLTCAMTLLCYQQSALANVAQPQAQVQKVPKKSIDELKKIITALGISEAFELNPTNSPDLYRIDAQDDHVYIDATGQYLINGDLLDFEQIKQQQKNQLPKFRNIQRLGSSAFNYANLGMLVLVDEQQKYIIPRAMVYDIENNKDLTPELNQNIQKIAWYELPLNQAIQQVHGNGQRQIAIFSDPHCPFCKQLENELKDIDNITIYTFIYPIKPKSLVLGNKIWCSKNPAQAWQDFILKKREPQNTQKCTTPLEKNLSLGESLYINATPSIIFSNGDVEFGAMPKREIEQKLQSIQPKP